MIKSTLLLGLLRLLTGGASLTQNPELTRSPEKTRPVSFKPKATQAVLEEGIVTGYCRLSSNNIHAS